MQREDASDDVIEFYDAAEERFEMLLNIFKVFGHVPEHGKAWTAAIMAILKRRT